MKQFVLFVTTKQSTFNFFRTPQQGPENFFFARFAREHQPPISIFVILTLSVGSRGRVLITVDAGVAGLQVGDDVLGTGLLLVKRGVGQLDHTRRSSGTAGVEQRQHVGRAADVDVRVDAAAEPHPPEPGRLHDDHVPERTAGVERFPLAVVLHQRRAAAAAGAPRCRQRRCQTNTSTVCDVLIIVAELMMYV